MTDSETKSLSPVFLYIFFLFPLIYLGFSFQEILLRAHAGIVFPFQLDVEEGFVLNQAIELSRGASIYKPIEELPYLVGNYAPVFPLLNAILIHLSEPGLFWGRVISLAAALGAGLLLAFMVFRRTRSSILSLLAPLLFLVTYEVHYWIPLYRVDFLALFFALAGLACFDFKGPGRITRCAALLFFLLAWLTKQNQLAAPAACCLALLIRDPRSGLRFTGSFVVSVLVVFLALNLATGWQYYLHTVRYNANEMFWHELWQIWIPHLLRFYGFYLAAVGVLIVWLVARGTCSCFGRKEEVATEGQGKPATPSPDHRDWPIDFLTLYFIISALTVISIVKRGAAANYLIEPLAATALFFAVKAGALGAAAASRPNSMRGALFAVVVVLMWGSTIHQIKPWIRGAMLGNPNPSQVDYEQNLAVLWTVENTRGRIFCETPIFLLMQGKTLEFEPFIMSTLAREKIWDQTPLLDAIRSRKYLLVVTTEDIRNTQAFFLRYTPEMVEAFASNYTLAKAYTLGRGLHYFLYTPRVPEAS